MGGWILVAADEIAHARGGSRGEGEIGSPGGVTGGDHERTLQPARLTCSPAGSEAGEEAFSQHDQDAVVNGEG